jgi:hypothetical protein
MFITPCHFSHGLMKEKQYSERDMFLLGVKLTVLTVEMGTYVIESWIK